jgi:hypothetical protein
MTEEGRREGRRAGLNYLLETLFANRNAVPNSEVPLVLAKSFPRALEMAEITSALVMVEKTNLSFSEEEEKAAGDEEEKR